MPRLFAAIELDTSARDRVAAASRDLAAELRGRALRWVRPEHLHLTLVFLGEVGEGQVAAVVRQMHEDIPHPSFEIGLGGFGVFPSRDAPRALWLGVRTGAEPVIGVQRTVAARLQALGFTPERRPFSPHLTLARWPGRGARPSDRPHHLHHDGEIITVVTVGAVVLFQSTRSSQGPTHTALAESRLTGSNPPLH